jgi:hypothetical protein
MCIDPPDRIQAGYECIPSRTKQKAGESQEDKMIIARSFTILIPSALFLIPWGYAQDLSGYRAYHLGMTLAKVAKQADMEGSEVKSISQRPAMIQQLEWRPRSAFNSSPEADPVKEILFDFYNGELFRILVSYNQERTEGLTDEDLIESISAKYGTPTKPAGTINVFSSGHLYSQDEKLIARWEDSQYSFNLFRLSYQSTPGMLIFSKQLELLALAAMAEAKQLDAQEAPQREIDRQKKLSALIRNAYEKLPPLSAKGLKDEFEISRA